MRLIELCAGTAALSLRAFDQDPLMPYMGGKGRYARSILDECSVVGVESVVLVDPGPWGVAWSVLVNPTKRLRVLACLRAWGKADLEAKWNQLAQAPPPKDPVVFTICFLFLQRLSFRGKPAGVVDDRWKVPGFNRTAAFGTPRRGTFGEVKPQLPTLITRISRLPWTDEAVGIHARAEDVQIPSQAHDTLVYIDPPYQGTTDYHHDLPQEAVIKLAQRWAHAGARVVISEAHPIEIGWRSVVAKRKGKKSSWQTSEFITMNFDAPQVKLFRR